MAIVLTDLEIAELEKMANTLRQDVIRMTASVGQGHLGGPLGMAEVFSALYFKVLRHDPKNPDWGERSRFILSNGHICPVQYAALARSGYFPVEELTTYRKINSRLQGHPHVGSLPGIENSGGPLGQGISQAVGRALAALQAGWKHRVYCMTSDGEHDEGQTWEALLFAGSRHLRNLTVLLDRNNIQIDYHTERYIPLEPLVDKYHAFKWHVIEIDGHNVRQVVEACDHANDIFDGPTVVICHAIPGKGVDYMENDPEWHDSTLTSEQAEEALRNLRVVEDEIDRKIATLKGRVAA
ncbi:MAG: transketolase [Actinobacteria bacterium]|nr:transketolase [Actinomycetota bacterium]